MQFWPHRDIGGVFLIDFGVLLLGMVLMVRFAAVPPRLLPRRGPQSRHAHLVPEDIGTEVGLFGIEALRPKTPKGSESDIHGRPSPAADG
jgi:hypothetical protein